VVNLAFGYVAGDIEELNARDGSHGLVVLEGPDDFLLGGDFDDVGGGAELIVAESVAHNRVAVG
jgi:hypothetical protein